jgi:hypothetical protein
MPLQEFYKKRTLTPGSRQKHESVTNLKRLLPERSFNKILRIIDQVVDEVVTRNLGKLVYTRTGFLLGHSSAAPHVDIEYIWKKIPETLIRKSTSDVWTPLESKHVLKTIGALVMWRIALRDEPWLVSFLDSGKFDVVTGNEIRIAQYWTNGDVT